MRDFAASKRAVQFLAHPLRWYHGLRRSQQLKAAIRKAQPLRLVVGAGGIADPGWIPTDVDVLDILSERDWARFFSPDTIDALLAEHVWEHLTLAQGLQAARLGFHYLKPGGYLRVAVPDGSHPDPAYIEYVRVGGSGAGADDHKVLYTSETICALFREAGFQTELLEYFDAAGRFHDLDWDPAAGMVHRSKRFDERNSGGQLRYTSIILDARKA